MAYADKEDYKEYQRKYKRGIRGFQKEERKKWFLQQYPNPDWGLLNIEEKYVIDEHYLKGSSLSQISEDLSITRDKLYGIRKKALKKLLQE